MAGRLSYINQSGKVIIWAQFDDAADFSNELAPVKIGGKWGYIDSAAKLAITPQFDLADPFADNGFALVGLGGKQLAGDFHDGRAAVKIGIVYGSSVGMASSAFSLSSMAQATFGSCLEPERLN